MLTTGKTPALIGVFETLPQADEAIAALLKAGFNAHQIGFAMREQPIDKAEKKALKGAEKNGHAAVERIGGGAMAGGVIGGLLGALTALAVPGVGPILSAGLLLASGGAIAGGFAGLMSTMEFSPEEIKWYQSELEAGRPVVAVRTGDRYSEALSILTEHGAYDINRRGTVQTANS